MPRPRILVFQHVPYEPLGTLDPLLKRAGFRIRYVNFGRDPEARPAIEKYQGLIILGGPMNSDQEDEYPNLSTEIDLILKAVELDIPILGICLGAQLVAKALGGSVQRNSKREIGWYDVSLTEAGIDDPVLSAFSHRQTVFQWHEDGIQLPPKAVHLAHSDASDVQAFRVGDRIYGFQFHLEVDAMLIERWLTVDANQAALREEASRISPDEIRDATKTHAAALETMSNTVFGRWVEQFNIERRQTLPSR